MHGVGGWGREGGEVVGSNSGDTFLMSNAARVVHMIATLYQIYRPVASSCRVAMVSRRACPAASHMTDFIGYSFSAALPVCVISTSCSPPVVLKARQWQKIYIKKAETRKLSGLFFFPLWPFCFHLRVSPNTGPTGFGQLDSVFFDICLLHCSYDGIGCFFYSSLLIPQTFLVQRS